MEHLKIDTGAVSLAINGDESRVITFYPTDVKFAEDFFGLAKSFISKRKEMAERSAALNGNPNAAAEELAMLRETYNFMREEIDRVFGAGTAQTAFGNHDSLTSYIQFFRGIEPYVRNARQRELDRYLQTSEGAVMDA